MHENAERFLQNELARAEAVVASETDNTKQHTPTIDNHRGQVMALQKALAWLEMDKPKVVTVIVEKKPEVGVIFGGIAGIVIIILIGSAMVASLIPS